MKPDPPLTVPESKIARLQLAYRHWIEAMRKWPPAVHETTELRRAIVALLKSAR